MANNVSEVNEEGPVGGAGIDGASKGVGDEAGNCGRCRVEVDGVEGFGKVDKE